jgi:hypothetical protein
MRDPKRIDRLLGLLWKFWHKYDNDQRFFQLVHNMLSKFDIPGDGYWYEDYKLIDRLEEYLNK